MVAGRLQSLPPHSALQDQAPTTFAVEWWCKLPVNHGTHSGEPYSRAGLGCLSALRVHTTVGIGDAPCCSWDSTAAACATAPRCSGSTGRPPRRRGPLPVCGRGGLRGCVCREGVPESVPIDRHAIATCGRIIGTSHIDPTILK